MDNSSGLRRHATWLRGGPADFLVSFGEGLTCPSPAAIGLALFLNVLAVVTVIVLVTPAFIASQDESLFADRATDYDAFVTARLFVLQHQAAAKQGRLIIMGGSTTRASLLESDLQEGLVLDGRHRLDLVKLCTNRQSLWDSLLIAENLPKNTTGVAVLGVSPSLFTMGDEVLEELARHPRLGLRSYQLDEEFRRRQLPVAPRTGVYAVDNAAYILSRIGKPVQSYLEGRPQYVDSQFVGRDPLGVRESREREEIVKARFLRLEENWPQNIGTLERIVHEITRARSMKMILVELPMNPDFIERAQLASVVRRHQSRIDAFAREHGIAYEVLNTAAQLAAEDFVDWAHLSGREAIRRSASVVLNSVRLLERTEFAAQREDNDQDTGR